MDRYAYDNAKKRSGSVNLALDELGECIPDPATGRSTISDEIARDFGFTESKVKVTLLGTRNDFKAYLEKEGISQMRVISCRKLM